MMRSSILGASTLLNVLIQHLPLRSLFWSKAWRACQASDPSIQVKGREVDGPDILGLGLQVNLHRGTEGNVPSSSGILQR